MSTKKLICDSSVFCKNDDDVDNLLLRICGYSGNLEDDPFFTYGSAIVEQEMTCNLFPPELDFTEVCSCDECATKIRKLLRFQGIIKYFNEELNEHSRKLGAAVHQCRMIRFFTSWMNRVFYLLRNNLKALVGKDEECYSRNPMEEALQRIDEKLDNLNFYGLGHILTKQGGDNSEKQISFSVEYGIIEGIDSCIRAGCEVEGRSILDEILRIENILLRKKQHMKYKKSDEAIGETTAVLQSYIKSQIEELMKLPEKLERKINEVIRHFDYFIEQRHTLQPAKDCISYVIYYMVNTRDDFWRQYLKCKDKVKGHDLSRLKAILDELCERVDSFFKDEWERDWTSIIYVLPAMAAAKSIAWGIRGANERRGDVLPAMAAAKAKAWRRRAANKAAAKAKSRRVYDNEKVFSSLLVK